VFPERGAEIQQPKKERFIPCGMLVNPRFVIGDDGGESFRKLLDIFG